MYNSKILSTWWFCVCYEKATLDAIINSIDIRGYEYILHDKDIKPDTGEPKEPHYHFLIQFPRNQRGSWFKRFLTDISGNILIEPCAHPQAAHDYMIHITERAKKEGGYLYDPSERIGNIDSFEPDEKDDSGKIKTNELRKLILEENKTPSELILKYNLSTQQIYIIERLYTEHMNQQLQSTNRPIRCIFIHGKPRTGKTTYVDERYKKSEFCRVSTYKNPFDSYAFQKVVVFDEFDGQIDITDMNNILDKFPCELSCRFYNKWAGWETVFVISNLPLGELYKLEHPDKRKAFRERFHTIICFDGFKVFREYPNPEHPDNRKQRVQQTFEQLTALSDEEADKLPF